MNYLVDDYLADIAGYNVSHCVHIQANMPDPIEETKYVCGCMCVGCMFVCIYYLFYYIIVIRNFISAILMNYR